MNSSGWFIPKKLALLAFISLFWLLSSLDEWKHWFCSHACHCSRCSTVQVARPPPCHPLLSWLLLGWLVKSVSISGRVHVCVRAPRAHANWGPKGKAFHADLSQLPWFKHFIARGVERGGSHMHPPYQCAQSTLGKAATRSTNNRRAAENSRFINLILSRSI